MKFDELSAVFDSWIGVACPGAAMEVRSGGEVLFRRFGGFTAVDPDEMPSLTGVGDGRIFIRPYENGDGRIFIRPYENGGGTSGDFPADHGQSDVTPPVRLPVTEDTRFDLASVTKPLSTALLTAVACDAGELSANAGLGDFGGIFATPARSAVSVRDVLLHRAAFPAWLPFAQRLTPARGIETAGSDRARAECLLIATASELEGRPGCDILYSDVGYIVLGMLLEQVCGEGLADLFHERIASPLELAQTGFMPIVPVAGPVSPACGSTAATAWCPLRRRVMQGEVHDDNAWFLGGAAGHAGLFSTVSETADLVDAWIFAARGASRLLGRDTARSFMFDDFGDPGVQRTPGFDRPSPSGSNAGDLRPAGTVGHLGFTGTSFWFDRDSGLSIVLLTNRTNPEMYGRQSEIKAMRRAVYDAAWKAAL